MIWHTLGPPLISFHRLKLLSFIFPSFLRSSFPLLRFLSFYSLNLVSRLSLSLPQSRPSLSPPPATIHDASRSTTVELFPFVFLSLRLTLTSVFLSLPSFICGCASLHPCFASHGWLDSCLVSFQKLPTSGEFAFMKLGTRWVIFTIEIEINGYLE